MSLRSAMILVGAFVLAGSVCWAADRSTAPTDTMRSHLSISKKSTQQLQRDPSAIGKSKSTNPYAGMSCAQLYILAIESQDVAEQEEFAKKNCNTL